MPDQLIQDPNKALAKTKEVTIKDIAEPMSYFLAGSFLISATLSSKSVDSPMQPTDWFSIAIGIILVASGFIFALVHLPILAKFREALRWTFDKYLYAFVFAITITRIALIGFNFRGYTPLFIASLAFLVIVILIVILASKSVFKDTGSLLTIVLTLNVITMFIVITGREKTELITALGLSLVFLGLAWYRVTRRVTEGIRDSPKKVL